MVAEMALAIAIDITQETLTALSVELAKHIMSEDDLIA